MLDYTSILRLELDHYNIDSTKSFETIDPSNHNHTINIFFNKDDSIKCPKCSSCVKITGAKSNALKYSTFETNVISLIVHRRRFKCINCNYSFHEDNPFSSETKSISYLTDIKIMEALKKHNKTFKEVALEFNVSDTYVTTLFDKRFEAKRKKLPEVLCIDEIYSKKLSRTKYCCVLFDPAHKTIVDILDSRRKDYLVNYFNHISESEKKRVKYVSIDMWESYADVAEKCFPNAFICVDSFHVIKHLMELFHKVRIRTMNSYSHLKGESDPLYWWYKRFWKFLSTDIRLSDIIHIKRNNIYVTKGQIVDYMLNASTELAKAYSLKEDYRSFNKNTDCSSIELYNQLEDLIDKFKISNIPEYKEFWKLLEHWKAEIVNSFKTYDDKRISNGPIERLNKDLKTIINLQYGIKNFDRFRNRVMYCFNNNSYILAYYKANNNQKHRFKK